jgi:hypothetical protein
VIKLLVLDVGSGDNSNIKEMTLSTLGFYPYSVRVFGLFTKALENHGYSCLVEAMADNTINDALLAAVDGP